MSDATATSPGKLERKTSFATLATYLVSLGVLALLNAATTTDLLTGLPDGIEVFIDPILPALVTLITGWSVAHKPGAMSASARRALGR